MRKLSKVECKATLETYGMNVRHTSKKLVVRRCDNADPPCFEICLDETKDAGPMQSILIKIDDLKKILGDK